MNAKAEQKEKSHAKILASASRLLRAHGIARTGVAEVMKGASMTVGGFYAHFASKDALIDEVLGRTATTTRERLFARISQEPEATRVDVILKRYLSRAHRDDVENGCALPAVVGEMGTAASVHGEAVREHIQVLVSGIAALLPACGTLPRRHLAVGLVVLMVGGLSLSRALRGAPLSDEVLRAARALGTLAVRAATKS